MEMTLSLPGQAKERPSGVAGRLVSKGSPPSESVLPPGLGGATLLEEAVATVKSPGQNPGKLGH